MEFLADADASPVELRQLSLQPDEPQLIRAAKALDPEAWDTIYGAYYPPILGYMKARVVDDAVAQDLASAVFVAALEGIGRYKERGRPLLAWLFGIARNQLADHLRKEARDRVRFPRLLFWRPPETEPMDYLQGEAAAASVAEDPAEKIERLDVLRAMQRLTTRQREVVQLRFFADLTPQETAAVMDKSLTAVYSLEARALTSLRLHLG